MAGVGDGDDGALEDAIEHVEDLVSFATDLDIEERHQILVDLAGSIDMVESGARPTRWRLLDAVRKVIPEASEYTPNPLHNIAGNGSNRVEAWTPETVRAEYADFLRQLMRFDAVDRHRVVTHLATELAAEERREVERWNAHTASKRPILARLFRR